MLAFFSGIINSFRRAPQSEESNNPQNSQHSEFNQDEFIKCIKDGNTSKIVENLPMILEKKWLQNQDKDNNSPLHYAAAFNKPDLIKLFLENGANIDAQTSQGVTALLYAVHERCPEAVQALFGSVEHIKPNFHLLTQNGNSCMDEAMLQLEKNSTDQVATQKINAMKTFEILIKMIYKSSNNDERKMMSFMSSFKGNEYSEIYNKIIRTQLEEEKEKEKEKEKKLAQDQSIQGHVKEMREILNNSTALLHNFEPQISTQSESSKTETSKKRPAENPADTTRVKRRFTKRPVS